MCCTYRQVRKAIVPGGQFRSERSTCSEGSGRTFGRTWSNQLAIELMEMPAKVCPSRVLLPF